MTDRSTKDVILDAAEELYSSQGFVATSLRAIIKRAGVNTAAIHYHFGSREGLVEAVLLRRAGPVNRRRLELLDRIERDHPEGPLPIDEVVRAFVDPVVEMVEAHPSRPLPRLMGHAVMESAHDLRPIITRVFKEVIERFVPAFARALPGVSTSDVMWRIDFMLGAMAFAVNVPRTDAAAFDPSGTRSAFEKLAAFVSAGMRASPLETPGKDVS